MTRPIALLFVALLGACGAETPGSDTPADSTPAASPAPGPDSPSAPVATDPEPEPAPTAFEGTTGRSASEGNATGVATLDNVRTATHPGFVRVVFTFRDQRPGYFIEYATEAPSHCGSGDPASVAGAAHLSIRMTPAVAHEFFGERAAVTVANRNVRVNGPVLKQMLLTCDFEADVTWVLGLDARRPYRVMALSDPPRLVVDVAQ